MEGDGDGTASNLAFQALNDDTMDLDFVDELLLDGFWLETSDNGGELNFVFSAPSTPGPPGDPVQHLASDTDTNLLSINLLQQSSQGETTNCFIQDPPLVSPSVDEFAESESQELQDDQIIPLPGQSGSFLADGSDRCKRLWIGPRAFPSPSSVTERLTQAIDHLKNWMQDRDVLIQIWVPIRKGGKRFLTTKDQPFSLLDPSCTSLVNYRGVSRVFQFPADKDSKVYLGLPGLVFLEKLPEWTPDVRFFRKVEYPRIDYAKQYDVRGSIAVPVFEKGSGSCFGVVEFVTTTQKTNYGAELETVCRALEAVDLRSSPSFSPPSIKASYDLHQAELPRIVELLTYICKTYKLPLAQTWAPCLQQGKDGCRHSDENYTTCVSTVDTASFVSDLEMLKFHQACSEYHLFKGQGLIGRAFITNKPVFTSDVTAFTKKEYPLSHHARIFGVCAAAAIPLRSIHAGSADFIFEFFLPKDCNNIDEQKAILNSLSVIIQQSGRKLHVVMGKASEREARLPVWEMVVASDETYDEEEKEKLLLSSNGFPSEEPLWSGDTMGAQQICKGVSISADSQKELKELRLTASCDRFQTESNHEHVFSDRGQLGKNSGTTVIFEGNQGYLENIEGNQDYSDNEHCSLSSKKSGKKRRNKSEKTISLQVLQQHFAGSLKEAAKSIGVCPTTLKRICRQHGISRWPSRKIKKVDHSLKKLQRVIDTVEGAQGAIQIRTFYNSFPKLNSPNNSKNRPFSPSKRSDTSNHIDPQSDDMFGSQMGTGTKCPSPSASQSSGSTCSTGAKNQTNAAKCSTDGTKDNDGLLKTVHSAAEIHVSNQEEPKYLARSESHKLITEPPNSLPEPPNSLPEPDNKSFRVKATYGDANVRFCLHPNWGFTDLQKEIAKRLNVEDFKEIGLKYLDDEHEWVLLTCDADLEECLVIHRLSQSQTIKLVIYHASKRDPFSTKEPS